MSKKFASDSPTIEEIVRLKKPNRKKCEILLDSELGSNIDELRAEISMLERKAARGSGSLADGVGKELDRKREMLDQLEEQAEESLAVFWFQDIGRLNYDKLVSDHRPTDDQKKMYVEAGGVGVLAYNLETFPPALISEASIEPEIPLEFATQICEEWGEGDIETLFNTALLACKERTSIPFSKSGIEEIPDLPSNSTTALSEESPTPSS